MYVIRSVHIMGYFTCCYGSRPNDSIEMTSSGGQIGLAQVAREGDCRLGCIYMEKLKVNWYFGP